MWAPSARARHIACRPVGPVSDDPHVRYEQYSEIVAPIIAEALAHVRAHLRTASGKDATAEDCISAVGEFLVRAAKGTTPTGAVLQQAISVPKLPALKPLATPTVPPALDQRGHRKVVAIVGDSGTAKETRALREVVAAAEMVASDSWIILSEGDAMAAALHRAPEQSPLPVDATSTLQLSTTMAMADATSKLASVVVMAKALASAVAGGMGQGTVVVAVGVPKTVKSWMMLSKAAGGLSGILAMRGAEAGDADRGVAEVISTARTEGQCAVVRRPMVPAMAGQRSSRTPCAPPRDHADGSRPQGPQPLPTGRTRCRLRLPGADRLSGPSLATARAAAP